MTELQQENVTDRQGICVLHIDNFEGPLDVLWDLIKRSKIDVTEISLAHITEQYISFLKVMDTMNIRVAVEFIRMASELLYYKSRALLPSGQIDDEYFVPPLPPELIQKLLEYKKYQQASRRLREVFEYCSNKFQRDNPPPDLPDLEAYIDVTLFDLLRAFAEVMESQKVVEEGEIVFDEILVSDRIQYIIGLLAERESVIFTEIFTKRPTRPEIVATFLAVLEMAKTKVLKIMQHQVFGTIRLIRNTTLPAAEPLPTA